MKSKALLIELIGHLADYEASAGSGELSLQGFMGFLHALQPQAPLGLREITGNLEQEMLREEDTPEVEIARLISLMYHYAKGYIRKALKDSPLQTVDEFSFVIVLMTYEYLPKTALINKNVMEKTSGIGIINRLIEKGLIRQFQDEYDKRTQLVAVTEAGRAAVFGVLPRMNMVSNIVAGNLSAAERSTLAYLLKKLDHYHHELYTHKRHAGLDELLP